MGNSEKKSYLLAILGRYAVASRQEKQKILYEFCAVCKYNRKYAIRILRKGSTTIRRKTGPKSVYAEPEFIEI